MIGRRRNVLMLGWEFPPAFTGGLGVACYNIVKSLSSKANVDLIIPYAEGLPGIDQVSVTGINQGFGEVEGIKAVPSTIENVVMTRVPVLLSAYPTQTIFGKQEVATGSAEARQNKISSWDDVSAIFKSRELYGPDVFHRTYLFALAVCELASKKTFDVIHAHDWPTFQAGIRLKDQSKKPLVLHIHALETDRAGENVRNGIYDLEREAMQAADHIIAVSNYTKRQIVSHYGIDEMKISVAHNGAERVAKKPVFKKGRSEKWITFVGRVTFQKGPGFVVETAARLVRIYPNVKFIMAGKGDLFQGLLMEVARRRLGKHFIFTGFLSRDKINDLLASSDAYFMPSVSEPFGLSAVEAVQQGVPSVISNRSGASEVLTNALSADFWDTDRFANYLHAILKYPALGNSLRGQALRDIEPLTWDNTTDKIINVYEEMISA